MNRCLALVLCLLVGCETAPTLGADGGVPIADAAPADAWSCAADHDAMTWRSSDATEAADLNGEVTTAIWSGDASSATVVWIAAPADAAPIPCELVARSGWLTDVAGDLSTPTGTIPRASAVVFGAFDLHERAPSTAGTSFGHFVRGRCHPSSDDGTWIDASIAPDDRLVGCVDVRFQYCIAPTGDLAGTFAAMRCPAIAAPETR